MKMGKYAASMIIMAATAFAVDPPATVTTDPPEFYSADIGSLYGTIGNTMTGRVFDAWFFWSPGDSDAGTNAADGSWANTNLISSGIASNGYSKAYIDTFDYASAQYTYRAAISNATTGWLWGEAVTFGTASPVAPDEAFPSSIPAVSYGLESSNVVIRVQGAPGAAYTLPFSASFVAASNLIITIKLEDASL